MFQKLIVGLLKLVGIIVGLFILIRLLGLIIPVDTLKYQEIPDSYFDATGVVTIPDNQNQYLKFIEFLSGDLKVLLSGQDEQLSKKYKEFVLAGDYNQQMDKFITQYSGNIIRLAWYYKNKVISPLEQVLLTGSWGAIDLSHHTIDAALRLYNPTGSTRLVGELNIIASLYCKIQDRDNCTRYQNLALQIGKRQIETNGYMILSLVGIAQTTNSFKNIIYNQSNGSLLRYQHSDLNFIDKLSLKGMYKGEIQITTNTIKCMNGDTSNMCKGDQYKDITEEFEKYPIRRGHVIDEKIFKGYMKDVFYQLSQCTNRQCLEDVKYQKIDSLGNISFSDKVRSMLGKKHMTSFVTRSTLSELLPRLTTKHDIFNELQNMKNTIK